MEENETKRSSVTQHNHTQHSGHRTASCFCSNDSLPLLLTSSCRRCFTLWRSRLPRTIFWHCVAANSRSCAIAKSRKAFSMASAASSTVGVVWAVPGLSRKRRRRRRTQRVNTTERETWQNPTFIGYKLSPTPIDIPSWYNSCYSFPSYALGANRCTV